MINLFKRPGREKHPPSQNVANFLADLSVVAPAAGGGHHAFANETGGAHGWVQFIINSPRQVTLHRLWTLRPGEGNGSRMLGTLCELADRHGVEICLKPLPFGRKPYRFSRQKLAEWYGRYGFTGDHKRMVRAAR